MSAARQLPVIEPTRAARRAAQELQPLPGGKGGKIAAIRSPLVARSAFGLVFLSVTIMALALIGVLVVNTNVVNGSYEITRMNAALRTTNQDIQTKRELLRRTEAGLPHLASELGLEPAKGAQVINISRYVAEISDQIIGGVAVRGAR